MSRSNPYKLAAPFTHGSLSWNQSTSRGRAGKTVGTQEPGNEIWHRARFARPIPISSVRDTRSGTTQGVLGGSTKRPQSASRIARILLVIEFLCALMIGSLYILRPFLPGLIRPPPSWWPPGP
jgi:hypothetical protein